MLGNFVRSAIASVLQPKDCPYPERPSVLINKDKDLQDERVVEIERLKAQLFFKNWVSEVSSQMKGGD